MINRRIFLKRAPLYTVRLLFFSFILGGCNFSHMGSVKKACSQAFLTTPPKKKVLILLNGLWQYGEDFAKSVQRISQAFKSHNIEVLVDILVEINTSEKDITQQAIEAFQQIKEKYAGSEYEIILLGHSQGGLRAAKILEFNQYEQALDIKGLVTTGTPWEGAPAARINKQTVKNYLNSTPISQFFYGFKYFYPASAQINDNYIDQLFEQSLPNHPGPGVKDMIPGCEFLNKMASGLQKNQVPILAIGGSNGDVKRLLLNSGILSQWNISPTYIHMFPLNSTYRYIFAGGWFKEHDMMVPLESQLAANLSKNSKFTTYTILDAIHDQFPGLEISTDQVLYNHPEVIEKIVYFAKKHFIDCI